MKQSPSWIQPIENELKEAIEIPSFSFSAPFPLDELSALLSSELGISPFSIEIGSKEWKYKNNFFTGLGSNPISIALQASPLSGECFWLMAYEDLKSFVSWSKDLYEKALELESPELIKGIYRYAILVAMEGVSKTPLFQDFSMKLTNESVLEDKGYAIDVALVHNENRVWGRLILSSKFKESFMNHFSKEKLSFRDILRQFPNIKIPLSITNGSLELTKAELSSIEPGDFILIDNAFYKPSNEKGSLKVMLGDNPLFQIKLKEGKFKILDLLHAYSERPVHAR